MASDAVSQATKNASELITTAAILGINLETVRTVNKVARASVRGMSNGEPKKRKEYETTRMFPTKKKTTDPDGYRNYMKEYMRKRNKSPPSSWRVKESKPRKQKQTKKPPFSFDMPRW